MEAIWNNLVDFLRKSPQDVHTVPKIKKMPIWFYAETDGNYIYISKAKKEFPSCKISTTRKLKYDEFLRIYPIYLQREKGFSVSDKAGKATVNQVYWYALLSLLDNKLKNNDLYKTNMNSQSKQIGFLYKHDNNISENSFTNQWNNKHDTKLDVVQLGDYAFHQTSITIVKTDICNTFLNYSGRTVEYMLTKKYYKNLTNVVTSKYSMFLHEDISIFLNFLFEGDDLFYSKFLNKNGADKFCEFKLSDKDFYNLKGLYAYFLYGELMYIGRCKDSFYQRFNINYGKISPINCFKEGQSTNTHINSLVNKHQSNICLFLCPMEDENEIISSERKLISLYRPKWNRQK